MSKPDNPTTDYAGPAADARAETIETTLGTDRETLTDTVWLLRYTTVKHGIQWPTPIHQQTTAPPHPA